jgi:DNA replication and repair protein RecF
MLIQRVRLRHVRSFSVAEFCPQPGFNLITGTNGSGKTSVLEAIHLLAHARSFRGRVRDGLVQQGEAALEVFAELLDGADGVRRIGLRHAGGSWEARLDGASVTHLAQLCEAMAVVTFEPGSHALIDGASEQRRRFLDWGLFHVERQLGDDGFLALWRRHARAHKQRNALLRQRADSEQMEAWEHELAQAGEALTRSRERYAGQLAPFVEASIAELLPAAGGANVTLQPGWRWHELSLADALLLSRDRDRLLGHTSLGPHRADLKLSLHDLPVRAGLSRGQAKLAALALLLAQARHLAEVEGHWPLLQLDDLASELDRDHQAGVLSALADSGAQVIVTGTEAPPGLAMLDIPVARFHVEHGQLLSADPS